jgi:hypothetical protein
MELNIKPISQSNELEVQVTFRLPRGMGSGAPSFEQIEEALAKQLNLIGSQASEHLLGDYDSQGEALLCNQDKKWTSKGRAKHVIETPFGAVPIMCHVYQSSAGGRVRVPLQERARLIGSATPRLAKMTAAKLAEMSCASVARDMHHNHLRPMSKSFAQDLGSAVAALVTVRHDMPHWRPLSTPQEVALIAIGVDGAHLNTRQSGWRQSMAGTLTLYDAKGERLETLYTGGGPGEQPRDGKQAFFTRMDQLIDRVRAQYPHARVVGISDGASDLQSYLARRCDEHLLDFHHAAEYLSAASAGFAPDGKADSPAAQAWASDARHRLRDEPQGALQVLGQLRARLASKSTKRRVGTSQPRLDKATREALQSAETYYRNHLGHMDYAGWQRRNQPIGSGVTEAACKTLIKQRLCQSGMRWSIAASDALISLRALYLTPSRWDHFWLTHCSTSPSSL